MDISTKSKFEELLKSISEGSILALNMSKGQAWGGAGAMVLFDDLETIGAYSHANSDEKLITKHAALIGAIYYRILEIVGKLAWYDYLSKFYFWGELTNSGRKFLENNEAATGPEFAIFVVNSSIKLVNEIEGGQSICQ